MKLLRIKAIRTGLLDLPKYATQNSSAITGDMTRYRVEQGGLVSQLPTHLADSTCSDIRWQMERRDFHRIASA
jgi:hypothetical protein